MKNKFSDLLNTEMNRKEFLGIIGLSFLAVIGYSAIVGILRDHVKSSNTDDGFGYGPYGGLGATKTALKNY